MQLINMPSDARCQRAAMHLSQLIQLTQLLLFNLSSRA